MRLHRRFVSVGAFALASVLLTGVALAGRSTDQQGSSGSQSSESQGRGQQSGDRPSLDQRIGRVRDTTPPGAERGRLELGTRLSEISPGGSRGDDARRRGAGIAGIAVNANGITVALDSENVRGQTTRVVDDEVGAILADHPELGDSPPITYEVKSLDVAQLSTPGGWAAIGPSGQHCTIAATTYVTFLGINLWYWLTAGHCEKMTPVHSAIDGTFDWASGSSTGASDSGLWYIGSYPVAAASNLVADGWSAKPISSQSDRPRFDTPGKSQVCMTGATSGTGCGKLVNIWVTAVSGVYYLRETDYKGCRAGDSGAPWFGRYGDGTVSLMGIEMGAFLNNGGCVYSDLQLALNERGVNLYR
jgi:hypothetical protein